MRGYTCFAHKHDSLIPEENHHIWPLAYHGPNVAGNRRYGCANAHGDTHYLLDLMLKTNDIIPWEVRRTYGPGVRLVAEQGYVAVMAYIDRLTP